MNNSLPKAKDASHPQIDTLENHVRGLPRAGFSAVCLGMNEPASELRQLLTETPTITHLFEAGGVILTLRIVLCYNVHAACMRFFVGEDMLILLSV